MKKNKEHIDFDDLIFENRNKDYGAYPIRKGYKKRFLYSMFSSIVIVIAVSVILDNLTQDFLPPPPKLVKTISVHIKEYKMPRPLLAHQKEDLTAKVKNEVKSKTLKAIPPPVFVNNTQIKNGSLVINSENSINISSLEVQAPDLDIKAAIKADTTPNKRIILAHIEDVTNDEAFTKVRTLPHYAAGDSAWYQYLRTNLNVNIVLRKGAMPSIYTAVIAFVVHPDSTLSDFKIVKDPGYGTGAEALRIIRKSGKWIPGTKNNKPVNFAQLQTVVFKINY